MCIQADIWTESTLVAYQSKQFYILFGGKFNFLHHPVTDLKVLFCEPIKQC